MDTPVAKALLLLTLPSMILAGYLYVMSKLSGREYVTRQLRDKLGTKDAKPLYERATRYNLEDVRRYWGALDDTARRYEQRFIKLDLGFPIVYGVVLGVALVYAFSELNRPFPLKWLLLPLILGMMADWTENLVQLRQLQLFAEGGPTSLSSSWIQVASVATMTKWIAFGFVALSLLFLAAKFIGQSFPRASNLELNFFSLGLPL